MNFKRRDVVAQLHLVEDTLVTEPCMCLPLSSLQAVLSQEDGEDALPGEKVIPAPQEFNVRLRAQLETCFPRSTPLSLLLLHVSQLEHISIAPQAAVLQKRQRYHAPASFLEQVLVNVRRAIRDDDQILMHEGIGAAIIFPYVDRQGIHTILERVYNNVSLLQAETVIPPLRHETDVAMGVASYPEPGASLEHLLQQLSITVRRFTLRPALVPQLWNVKATAIEEEELSSRSYADRDKRDTATHLKVICTFPFMQLPAQLPTRLKQLIPYHIALELRCAPVGRDHHCLTVAMADPANITTVHYLREITGLTIFPVSCDSSALNILLASKW